MGEQTKHQESSGVDQIYKRDAVELARTLNANIGIVAYGKAFYFYKVLLEEMGKQVGQTIELGHLVALCAEKGREVDICNTRCFITLNALDITEEQWFNELEEIGNGQDDDCEDDDEEKEDDV